MMFNYLFPAICNEYLITALSSITHNAKTSQRIENINLNQPSALSTLKFWPTFRHLSQEKHFFLLQPDCIVKIIVNFKLSKVRAVSTKESFLIFFCTES